MFQSMRTLSLCLAGPSKIMTHCSMSVSEKLVEGYGSSRYVTLGFQTRRGNESDL
jgi:hypothetical protein